MDHFLVENIVFPGTKEKSGVVRTLKLKIIEYSAYMQEDGVKEKPSIHILIMPSQAIDQNLLGLSAQKWGESSFIIEKRALMKK